MAQANQEHTAEVIEFPRDRIRHRAEGAVRRTPRPCDALSFMRRRKRGQDATAAYLWWNVTPSGDYGEDCGQGHKLGREFLDYMGRSGDTGTSTLLGRIVAGMVERCAGRRLSGIEIGFLQTVGEYAMASAMFEHGQIRERH